jgi:hypothetical protein
MLSHRRQLAFFSLRQFQRVAALVCGDRAVRLNTVRYAPAFSSWRRRRNHGIVEQLPGAAGDGDEDHHFYHRRHHHRLQLLEEADANGGG